MSLKLNENIFESKKALIYSVSPLSTTFTDCLLKRLGAIANMKDNFSNLGVWSVVCRPSSVFGVWSVVRRPWSNSTRAVLLTMVFSLFLLSLRAQVQWNLNRDENGIKVYSAPGESSKFKKIKVEASFPGSIAKLKAILLDVNNNKLWVYHTRQSHLLERVNENEVLYYAETSLPWPMSNRDLVIRMSFHYDSTNGDFIVTAIGVPDAVPVNNGIVRIKDFHARWEVKPHDINQIAITYYLTINPAGSIPPGISNMFVTKGPFETFKNLSGLLKN